MRIQLRRLSSRYRYLTSHPLTKESKAATIKRYFAFHIAHRILSGPSLHTFVNDVQYLACHDYGSISHHYFVGLNDFEEMSFLLHFLRTEDAFVDVGANVGAYSLLSAGVCNATTIAIEPSLRAYQHLLLNLRINDLLHLAKTYKVGVGAEEGSSHLRLTKTGDTSYVSTDNSTSDMVEIELYPLDQIAADENPILVKIDVEGYESQVLRGMQRMLSSSVLRAVIIELNASGRRYGVEDSIVHEMLLANGFAPYAYFPFERTLRELPSFRHDVHNTIYIRDVDFVKKRLKGADSFNVLDQVI